MHDCVFCQIVAGHVPSWKVYENEHAYAFLDIHPTGPYHTLVIPKRHYADVFDAPEAELKEVIAVVKKLADLYREKLGIRNVQIINSSGPEAQQDVFHLHFHLVPRRKGDGQDVRWTRHPELQERFQELLAALQ